MTSNIHIVVTPTADTSGSTLMITCGNKQYLMGAVPEGLSRALTGRVSRMTNIEHLFITGLSRWSNTGGLLGLVLSIAEANGGAKTSAQAVLREKIYKLSQVNGPKAQEQVKSLEGQLRKAGEKTPLTIYAPPNMTYQIATARRFIFRRGMPMKVVEVEQEASDRAANRAPDFEDENLRVWGMAIHPEARPLSPAASPSRSRKRSHEAMEVDENGNGSQRREEFLSKEKTLKIAQDVVSHMFDSDWSFDALQPSQLKDVKLPAKVFVRDRHGKVRPYQGPLPGSDDPQYDPLLPVLTRTPWPAANVNALPPTTESDVAVSYIAVLPDRRGKFDPHKALELKVERGPKWAALSRGETVKNADGIDIVPEQVLGQTVAGNGFAMINLPEDRYIDNLLAQPEWQQDRLRYALKVIFWSAPPTVLEDSRILDFMGELSSIQHIVLDQAYTGNYLTYEEASAHNTRLSVVDEHRFRLATSDKKIKQLNNSHQNIHVGQRDQVVQLSPNFAIDQTKHGSTTPAAFSSNSTNEPDAVLQSFAPALQATAAKARADVEAHRSQIDTWSAGLPGKDVEIISLGTGSAIPQKTRNVSATLVRVPGWGSMLLDCGEGTLGQIDRALSPQARHELFGELRLIANSHLHADHHLGTINVIRRWYQQSRFQREDENASAGIARNKLVILGRAPYFLSLVEYSSVQRFGWSSTLSLQATPAEPRQRSSLLTFDRESKEWNTSIQAKDLGLADLQAVLVDHCKDAMAYAFTWPDGFKLSYSGDCRPSAKLAAIGKNSTVCIHEATFGSDLYSEAVAKKHSTIGEALTVANAMNAKVCLLTHFSQRYMPGGHKVYELLQDLSNGKHMAQAVPGITDVGLNGDSHVPSNHTSTAEMDDEDVPIEAEMYNDQADGEDADGQDTDAADEKSSRGPPLQRLNTDMAVVAAFDFMRFKVGEASQIKYYLPGILELYDYEELADLRASVAASEVSRKNNGKLKPGQKDDLGQAIATRQARIRVLEKRLGIAEAATASA